MPCRPRALGAMIALALFGLMPGAASAWAGDCAAETALLVRDESELPKVELANPLDTQNTCITLEVNLDFARRLAAHQARCPADAWSDKAPQWTAKAERDKAAFAKRKCKRSLF